jgi:hypothetical protein
MELPEGAHGKALRGFMSPGAFFLFGLPLPLPEETTICARRLIVRGEGRKMRWILIEEDVSIWKLLFILSFFALLIFVLVQTAPSAEVQCGGTLF